MKKLFFVSSGIKLGGAPKTRVNGFANIFSLNGDNIVIGKHKLKRSAVYKSYAMVYVESSTNRLSFSDFLSLMIIKFNSKCIIVFIRDVYIEYFPENYKGFRKRLTLLLNRMSYYFLTFVSDYLVFPTKIMGDFYYDVNTCMPQRRYYDLPPGTVGDEISFNPDFNKSIGILYLGAVSYENSGFDYFMKLYKNNKFRYKFFVLTNDKNVFGYFEKDDPYITIDFVERNKLKKYLKDNNILFALHTRPRNDYDDMTFPIKVLDFISLGIPFITERHKPLLQLLGSEYPLFAEFNEPFDLSDIFDKYTNDYSYSKLRNYLKNISNENTYEKRYLKLESICKQDI